MTSNSTFPNGAQAVNLQDVTRSLERALKSRTEAVANAAGSLSASPPPPSPLLKKLVDFFSSKTSPRGANPSLPFGRGCFLPPRSSRGLSPSQSASSDSSGMSGGVSGFLPVNTSPGMERTNLVAMGSINSSSNAASTARRIYARGLASTHIAATGSQPRVVAQDSIQLMPSSPLPPSNVNVSTGGPPAKVTRKRKRRPSTKAPPSVVHTTEKNFRATVQELTGWKAPLVVCPNPERPQANAVPTDVSRDPPARPDSSPTLVSSVCCPRVPEAPFTISDSSTSIASSSRSSGLNYLMGYDEGTPSFLEALQQDYDENLGQLPGDSLQPASDPSQYKSREVDTTAATPTEASGKEAALLSSESKRKDGIPREHNCLGTNQDSGLGLYMADQFLKPSPLVEFRNRPTELDSFGTESDNCDDMIASWINI